MTQAFIIMELDNDEYVGSCVLYDAYISHTGKILQMFFDTPDTALSIAKTGTFSNFGFDTNGDNKYSIRRRADEDECIYGDLETVTNDYYDYLYLYSKAHDTWMVKLPNDESVWFKLSDVLEGMYSDD